jgi:putative SbcD/Mre11-related phosphoesterase
MTRAGEETGMYRFDDWLLSPDGAAIHASEKTAVIADVHLGYEWARGAGGDCVVAHSLAETKQRLARVLSRAPISRLVVAGDLIESPRDCPRTAADVQELCDWLAGQGVSVLMLEGNHDRLGDRPFKAAPDVSARSRETCTVAGWTIAHGHKPLAGRRTISGHHHPILRHDGLAALCFMVGGGRIVLPAFSANAAGCDVTSAAVPRSWRTANLRCIVSTGEELLDFGPINELRRRLMRVAH